MASRRKKQKLNPLALDRLAHLLKVTGHRLTPDDFDAMARLNELAERVTNGEDEATQSILDLPVPCGNITLRKPSLGNLFWFNECGVEWFSDEPEMCDLLFAYLLATPNEIDATADLTDKRSTRRVVSKWARSLTATQEEFSRAIGAVYPSSEDGGGDAVKEGPICALLAREYGENPQWWLWCAPLDLAQAMISDYRNRMEAEHEASRKSATRGKGWHKGGSAKPVAPMVTPRMKDQKRLREYVNALQKRWTDG